MAAEQNATVRLPTVAMANATLENVRTFEEFRELADMSTETIRRLTEAEL